MSKFYAAALLATLTVISPFSAGADETIDNAFNLCQAIEANPLSTEACKVSGWAHTVTGTVDLTSTEARMLCDLLVEALHSKGKVFRAGWKLIFKSPYSGDKNIARCDL